MNIPKYLEDLLEDDIEFNDDIYEQMVGMIKHLAYQHSNDPHLVDDLIQEGWEGVRIACDQYSPHFGASLKTYARTRARGKMQQYLRNKASVVHIPLAKQHERQPLLQIDQHDHSEDRESYCMLYDSLADMEWGALLIRHYIHGESFSALATEFGRCRVELGRLAKEALKELKDRFR